MAQKQKSRTTKSPLMQDWVFRLGVQSVYPSSKVRNIWFLSRLSFSQTLKMRQKQDISHHNFIEKFKNKFVKTSLWPSLPHMNTTKTIPGIFLSLPFTPTPSLRFLKVYYFTKLKYVHEIQFTLILLWWDIFWELKPKNLFFVERSTNVLL